MPSVVLSPIGGAGEQFFDNSGNVLSGGKIYTYSAGTTTPLATYNSVAGITANANPIVLNAAGRVAGEIWLIFGSSYKFVLKTSTGVTVGTWDNITGTPTALTIAADRDALAALTGMADGDRVLVKNWGFYRYDLSSVVTADDALVVEPDTTVGRWVLEVDGDVQRTYVSVKTYGAVGDGVTDDSAAIQDAIDYVATSGNGVITFPQGTYLIGTKLTVTTNNIVLNGPGATLKLKDSTNTGLLRIGPVNGATTQQTGNQIIGLTLDGNKANQSNSSTGTLSGVVACLETYNLANPIIRDVTITGAKGVGWKCWGNNGSGSGLAVNTLASGVYIYAPSGVGFLGANCKLGMFSDLFVLDAGGNGIELVNDYTVAATCEETLWTNIHVHNSTGIGLCVYSGVTRVQFSNLQLTLTAGGGADIGGADPYNNSIPSAGVSSSIFTNVVARKGTPNANVGLNVARADKCTFSGWFFTNWDTCVATANSLRNTFSDMSFLSATTFFALGSSSTFNLINGMLFYHPGSGATHLTIAATATDNTILGLQDYDASKISVNTSATNNRFGVTSYGREATSSPITVVTEDQIINVNIAGAGTVNLPANPEPFRAYRFKDTGNTGASGHVYAPSSGTIDGAATYTTLGGRYALVLIHDGTNWSIH